MPQPQQVVNIQKMSANGAKNLLLSIWGSVVANPAISQDKQKTLIDATDHSSFDVVKSAFLIIRRLTDKRPFVPALLKHAADHARPIYAVAAYEGIRNTDDFSPFYQAIENGVLSHNFEISSTAITAILDHARPNNSLDPKLNQAVIYGMNHPNPNIASFTMGVIRCLNDKGPFIVSLQNWTNNQQYPQLAQTAADILNMGSLAGFVATPKNVLAALIGNVRLDFNIEANGGGPGLHKADAMPALCKLFDLSTKGGIVTVKAKVFFDPSNKLSSDDILGVKFPEDDKNDILTWITNGTAPEFDLRKDRGDVYEITLKDRPSF